MLTLEAFPPGRPRAMKAARCAMPVAFAAGLEVAKLFVEGRSLQSRHVLLAAVGAILGLAAAPMVGRMKGARGRWLLGTAAVALVTYHELRPFDFTASAAAVRGKISHIEWAPFASYLRAEPEVALFDAGKKVVLGGLLGAVLPARSRRAAVGWALLLAALLELGQLAERSHQTSVTDVGLLTVGAWLGGLALARYRAVLDSPRGGAAAPASALRHE